MRVIRNNASDQAELFNEFFYDQFSCPSTYDIPFEPLDEPDKEFYISRFGVLKLLQNINSNKAAGPDGIHGKILKNCATSLALPLSLLYNKCYNIGSIPNEWKSANVVPFHKKGDKSLVENYRPISLTCLVMKTFEICIRDEIMARCSHLINGKQHGFLPEKSCTTQMIPYVEDFAFSLNKSSTIDVVYFDFAKAFDSVNHDIILSKLKTQYKISGKLLKFITAYLKDRTQCVVISGTKSSSKPVLSGVPQGSILGPLLFVLFINDLPDCVSSETKIALYADDTKIWRNIVNYDDHEALQKDISSLLAWANANKMKFHPNKCTILSLTYKRPPNMLTFSYKNHQVVSIETFKFPFYYYLGHICLYYVKSEKDLGVYVNSKLKWSEQCKALLTKANYKLGLIKRTCAFTNNSTQRRSLYLALVRSQFEHCSVIWRPLDMEY